MSTTPDTNLCKGADGWEAQTDFEFDTVGETRRILRVATRKHNTSLLTSAAVYNVASNGLMTHAFNVDFCTTLMREPKRCSQKSVTEQHALYSCKGDDILALAREFYAKKAGQLPAPKRQVAMHEDD